MHPFYVAKKAIIILPNMVTLKTGSVRVGAGLLALPALPLTNYVTACIRTLLQQGVQDKKPLLYFSAVKLKKKKKS